SRRHQVDRTPRHPYATCLRPSHRRHRRGGDALRPCAFRASSAAWHTATAGRGRRSGQGDRCRRRSGSDFLLVAHVAAAGSGAMMPLVLFTILLAIAIASSPEASREMLTKFFRAFSNAMLILVRWVILVAPIGVFAL